MKSLFITASVALLLTSVLTPLEAKTYTFDDPADYDAFYRTGSAIWIKTNSGGISGTPWYTFTSPNNTVPGMLVLNTPFSGDQDQFTLGINFLWRGSASSTQEIFSLGIGRAADSGTQFVPRNNSDDTKDPLGAQTNQQLHLGLALMKDNPHVVQVKGLSIVDGKRAFLSDKSGTTATLQDDSWYYMEVTFNKSVIPTGYDVTLSLFESQQDGSKGSNPILSWTTTQHNAGLMEGDVFAFLSGVSVQHSNIVGVDNFYTSIPEGQSIALFLGGATVLTLAACRTKLRKAAH